MKPDWVSRAVFLDRDGTIIEDRGHLRDPSQVVFYEDTVDALRFIGERFRLFIVTNQPGVAEGVVSMADVDRVNGFVLDYLGRSGVTIEQAYCCPHRRSDACRCIKPSAYYPLVAAQQHGLDLARSFAVGDHPHDVEMARNAGARGIYVLTGHGEKHRADLRAGFDVATDIAQAAEIIARA